MLKLKKEILKSISTTDCCGNAFLSAVFSGTKISINSDELILDCPELIQEKVLINILNLYPNLQVDIAKTWFKISGDISDMLKTLGLYDDNLKAINGCNQIYLQKECCKITYVKAIFLCLGKVYYNEDSLAKSNGYSLEIVFKDYQLADDVLELCKYLNLNLKSVKRGNNIVIYTKDSQTIIEVLVKLGAVNGAFELQNNLVMRELRNDANRKGNCFDANLNKTLNASMEQVKAIEFVLNNYGLDYLDENLRDVALLRLANPDVTLKEMQQLYSKPISRAGIKYKLDKIVDIYKQLKK